MVMCSHRAIYILVLLISCCSSMPPGLGGGKGLYDVNDKVTLLNVTNFRSTIYGTNNAWVVQFYNSWCGHCHKFAPVYKSLAANLYGWSDVLKLGAIDCSLDDNNPVCRDYDVLGYPTLKFFSANSPTTNLGIEIPKKSSEENNLRRIFVGILLKEELEGRGTSSWPNISPYRNNDVQNLWRPSDLHPRIKYVILIFEENGSSVASEVILDLGTIPEVVIRSVPQENEALARLLGVHNYPAVVLLKYNQQESEFLRVEQETRDGIRLSIRSYLEAQDVHLPPEPENLHLSGHDNVPKLDQIKDSQFFNELEKLGDVVFLADLEKALRYQLLHEIPQRKVIKGEALNALKRYLYLLTMYFPTHESGIHYLTKLKDTIDEINDEISGVKFKNYVTSINGGLESILMTKDAWIGCRGSESRFRGYPCGVWTTFHYMTVAARRNVGHLHFDPFQVLDTMYGYIKYYFGCTECAKHFGEMFNKSMIAQVNDADTSILWLWSAHNQVNQRLSGKESEDPLFPKIQFPKPERCPDCKDSSDRWIKANVLKYLLRVYDQDNVNSKGSNRRLFPFYLDKDKDRIVKTRSEDESPSRRSNGFSESLRNCFRGTSEKRRTRFHTIAHIRDDELNKLPVNHREAQDVVFQSPFDYFR